MCVRVTAIAPLMQHTDEVLLPDRARVITRLFLPGEELPNGRSRTGAVVARVLALSEGEVEQAAAALIEDFSCRHTDLVNVLAEHASTISSHLQTAVSMSRARALLMGASFTAEYAVEGAAVCNPSAVLHPDQSGLLSGQARLAVTVRAIGEGHLSSLGFCTAVVGAGPTWAFEPRALPVVLATSTAARWSREHLRAVLADQGRINGLTHSLLASLPDNFTAAGLEHALANGHQDLLRRPGSAATIDELRRVVASA